MNKNELKRTPLTKLFHNFHSLNRWNTNGPRKKLYEVAEIGKYMCFQREKTKILFINMNRWSRWTQTEMSTFYCKFFVGDKTSVIQLIQNGVNIDETDSSGRSALFSAALNSKLEFETPFKWNVCKWFLYSDHGEIVDLLIRNGANIELVDKNMLTALTVATAAGNELFNIEQHLFKILPASYLIFRTYRHRAEINSKWFENWPWK